MLIDLKRCSPVRFSGMKEGEKWDKTEALLNSLLSGLQDTLLIFDREETPAQPIEGHLHFDGKALWLGVKNTRGLVQYQQVYPSGGVGGVNDFSTLVSMLLAAGFVREGV